MATLPSVKTFLVEGYVETRVPWSVEVEAFTEEEAEELAENLVDTGGVDLEDYSAKILLVKIRRITEEVN